METRLQDVMVSIDQISRSGLKLENVVDLILIWLARDVLEVVPHCPSMEAERELTKQYMAELKSKTN